MALKRMAGSPAVGAIIEGYMAAPQGVGYSDKAVKPQDLKVSQTPKSCGLTALSEYPTPCGAAM